MAESGQLRFGLEPIANRRVFFWSCSGNFSCCHPPPAQAATPWTPAPSWGHITQDEVASTFVNLVAWCLLACLSRGAPVCLGQGFQSWPHIGITFRTFKDTKVRSLPCPRLTSGGGGQPQSPNPSPRKTGVWGAWGVALATPNLGGMRDQFCPLLPPRKDCPRWVIPF